MADQSNPFDSLLDSWTPPGIDPRESAAEVQAVTDYFEALKAAGGYNAVMLQEDPVEILGGETEAGNILTSFLSALGPEFIGMDTPGSVEAYRQQNPVRGFVSQGAGMLAPFLVPMAGGGALGVRLAAKIPGLAKAVKFAEMAEHPIRAAAVKEAVQFAPLELARVGAGTVAGIATDDPGAGLRVAKHAALDLAIIGGFGAGIGVLRGARPWPRDVVEGEALLQEAIPSFRLDWSAQEKLRALVAFAAEAPAEAKAKVGEKTLDTALKALMQRVRVQEPGYRQAYVKSISFGAVEGAKGKNAAQALGYRFQLGGETGSTSRSFTIGERGFPNRVLMEEAEKLAGLPKDWEAYALYPRFVSARSDQGGKALRKSLVNNMQRVDSKWYIAQQENGLYVLAKRLRGRAMPLQAKRGEAAVGREGDQFLLLQTDRPDVFMPNAERFAQALNKPALREAGKQEYNAAWKSIPAAKQFDELERIAPAGSAPLPGIEPGKVAAAIAERMTPEARLAFQKAHGLARFFSKRMKEYFGPALHQFSDSPRFQIMYQKARTMFNLSVVKSNTEFFGPHAPSQSRHLFGQLFEKRISEGSLDDLISKLTPQGLRDVNEAITANIPVKDAAEWASADALKLLQKLQTTDQAMIPQMKATFELVEAAGFEPLQAHYMVSRSWQGAHRVPLTDAEGKIRAIASGKDRSLAKAEADALIERLGEQGIKLKYEPKNIEMWSREEDLRQLLKVDLGHATSQAAIKARTDLMKAKDLGRFEQRKGVLGYRSELNKGELKKMVYGHLLESNRYMTQQVVYKGLGDEFLLGKAEFPELANQLSYRIGRMAGEASEFDRDLRQFVDKNLAPFIGPNVASRTVRATNRGLFTLTLGMGDMGFVALNAMTPIQTALPELAFLMTAAPERLAKYYTSSLVMGERQLHTVRHVSPGKMLREAMRDMGKPGEELRAAFTRAQNEMVISPRFIEAFVGESSQTVMSLRKTLKGEQGFYDFIMRASEYGPAKSEEFSRGLAFVMGHNVGRDFFGLQGKQLYRFASEFVGRTMYNYGTGDRPKIITGTIGTLFGLFKNWTMHYMANYMVYAGEGLLRGNWKPLLWQNAGTFGIAGLGALPGYGVANAMSKAFSDQTLMEHTYELFNHLEPGIGETATDIASDVFFNGAPALLGVTLQGRAAPPGAEVVRDVNMLYSTMLWDRAVHARQFVGEALDYAANIGRHPLDSRKVTNEFYRAFTPRTMYRFIQTAADRGLRSLSTDNMLISPVSIPDRFKFVFGLTPVDIDKAFVINDELFKRQSSRRERISAYGSAIAESRRKGEYLEAIRLHKDAMLEGLEIDSVEKSANARETKLKEPLSDRQFKSYQQRALSRSLRVD